MTMNPTACLILIGNELLSGRTQDTNLSWLAIELNKKGIRLMEARVIPDIEETIIETVNQMRRKCTYVFTTGGIGPTHDDITSAAIAKAFGKKLVLHPDAKKLLKNHYADQLNEARMKMAYVPEGAALIPNPVSAAPGFRVENVYVMAGVPRIMQAMVDAVKHELATGQPMQSRTISVYLPEGTIAAGLSKIQDANPDVEIGSYPFVRQGKLGSSLVMRCTDTQRLLSVHTAVHQLVTSLKGEIVEESENLAASGE